MAKAMVVDVQVRSGTRPNGTPWTRYTVRDGNGGTASTFRDDLGAFLQKHVGQFVELETKVGDRGTDIVSATELRPTPGASGGDADPRGRSISRSVALKAAVELAVAGKLALPGPSAGIVLDTISVANDFARWLEEEESDDGPPPFDPDEV